MTLAECYAALGGDYEGVCARLHGERLVKKFALKFLDDGSFSLLRESMESRNWEEAFRAAHTIKGMCLNLGFTRLQTSSSALCEALRHGYTPEAEPLFRQVEEDYGATAAAIRTFQAEGDGQ